MADQIYLDRTQAADYIRTRGLRCTKGTLQKFASVGGGPIYRKFGARVVYTVDDLNSWIDGRLTRPMRSTSDTGEAG